MSEQEFIFDLQLSKTTGIVDELGGCAQRKTSCLPLTSKQLKRRCDAATGKPRPWTQAQLERDVHRQAQQRQPVRPRPIRVCCCALRGCQSPHRARGCQADAKQRAAIVLTSICTLRGGPDRKLRSARVCNMAQHEHVSKNALPCTTHLEHADVADGDMWLLRLLHVPRMQ